MEAPTNGLNLRIGGHTSEFRPTVIERATLMIRTVLEAANVRGQWLYMVTGPSESIRNSSQYSMEVRQASEVLVNMVHVVMRAFLGPGGALTGMLKLPPEVRSKQFIVDVQSSVDIFNGSGWQGVLVSEVRQAACYVGKPPVTTALKSARRAVQEPDEEDLKPPARVAQLDGPAYLARERERTLPGSALARPAIARTATFPVRPELPRVASPVLSRIGTSVVPPPKFPISEGSAPIAKQEAAMSDPKTERNDKLAEFLRQVLAQDSVSNGEFSGKGITKIAKPLFPDKPDGWLRMGIVHELMSLEWVRHVAPGLYQVEQHFVNQHRLGLTITPIDMAQRGVKVVRSKTNGHTNSVGGLQALLDKQVELQARIRTEAQHERQQHEDAIAEAIADVERAQVRVTAARKALAAFEARHADLLVPVPDVVTPTLPVGTQ